MDRDRYEKYIQAVLEEVPEAEAETLFESFRRFEEEYYIPPRDAIRTVIRTAKALTDEEPKKFKDLVEGKDYILLDGEEMESLLREEREGRLQDDAVEPEWDDTKRKEEIIKWFMERMENVPYGSYMDVKIALSYEKDGVFYDV